MQVSLTKFSGISDYNSWFTSYFCIPSMYRDLILFISALQASRTFIQRLSDGTVYVYGARHKVYILFVISPLCISFVNSGTVGKMSKINVHLQLTNVKTAY